MTSTIEFVRTVRPGEKYSNGSSKSERVFLDVIVNGSSQWTLLGKPHDMVSVLCTNFAIPETLIAVDRLLLKADADLPNNRRSLFVCAECGDLGCGAITLRIAITKNQVIWSEFGYENNYMEGVQLDNYKDVGNFEFDEEIYSSAFLGAMEQLRNKV